MGEPGDSQTIINEWGGAWVVPRLGEGDLSWPWVWVWITYTHLQLKRRLRERDECSIWNTILSHIFYVSRTFPNSSLPQLPPERQDPKYLFKVAEMLVFPSSESALSWQGAADPTYKRKIVSPTSLPWGSFGHKFLSMFMFSHAFWIRFISSRSL
jgi:hypothetical protein